MKLPDPEKVAGELLARAGQIAPPVDLNRVVALWPGLEISADDLERPGYLLDLGARGGEIVVRDQDPPTRQRYTIAHELGHWVIREAGAPSREKGYTMGSDALIERWCDQF